MRVSVGSLFNFSSIVAHTFFIVDLMLEMYINASCRTIVEECMLHSLVTTHCVVHCASARNKNEHRCKEEKSQGDYFTICTQWRLIRDVLVPGATRKELSNRT